MNIRYLPTTLSPVEQLYDTSFRVLIFKHSNVSKQKPFEKFGWLPTFTILPSWQVGRENSLAQISDSVGTVDFVKNMQNYIQVPICSKPNLSSKYYFSQIGSIYLLLPDPGRKKQPNFHNLQVLYVQNSKCMRNKEFFSKVNNLHDQQDPVFFKLRFYIFYYLHESNFNNVNKIQVGTYHIKGFMALRHNKWPSNFISKMAQE